MGPKFNFFISGSHAVAMSQKFAILPNKPELLTESVFPVYPNEILVHLKDTLDNFTVKFCVPNEIYSKCLKDNTNLTHIAALVSVFNCNSGINLYVFRNQALIYCMRLSDPVYINLIHFDQPEDLLFHIEKVKQLKPIEADSQAIFIHGDIDENSQIFRLFKIYNNQVILAGNFIFFNA